MILTVIFDSACAEETQKINPSPGLNDALEVLQYLADHGNHFAIERLKEIQTVWSHLSVHHHHQPMSEPSAISSASSSGPLSTLQDPSSDSLTLEQQGDQPNSVMGDRDKDRQQQAQAHTDLTTYRQDQQGIVDADFWNSISHFWLPQNTDAGGAYAHINSNNANNNNEMLTTSPSIENTYNYYQSLYSNLDWTPTGEDTVDFAELGRYILNNRA